VLTKLAALLAAPLCGACAAPCAVRDPLCERCRREILTARVPEARAGTVAVVSAVPYDGVGSRTIAAMKFAGRLAPAVVAAEAMAAAWERSGRTAEVVVPVPSSPARARLRGFDLTYALARLVYPAVTGCFSAVLARADGPRQVGRKRSERVADPPRVHAPAGAWEADFLLVDDVFTTGATLEACGRALLRSGARSVQALTFARADSFGVGAGSA
jgi:predicted amidophosphoribosyltransferase